MQPPKLICLPPAGAGPGLFRPWRMDDPQVIAPSIPGREARFNEGGARDLDALADGIAEEVAGFLDTGYGLFGYSMGGTVAFLLAERLIRRGLPGPEALFVLGALPPHLLHRDLAELATLPSDAFWDEIARIGGTPREIIDHAEMRALLEPALRGDFAICGAFRHDLGEFRLNCPVHVLIARDDHLVPRGSAAEWSAFTTSHTVLHDLPGAHMLDADAFRALRARIRGIVANFRLSERT